jgi:RNA polymerase sigma-70 factor (ECF subfamily)
VKGGGSVKSLVTASVLSKAFVPAETSAESERSTAPELDEVLMSRLQGEDSSALEALFHRYSAVVHNVGLRILRDRDEAQELVQDVFLSVFRKGQLYSAAKGSVRSWLIQIAYHRAFDRREHLQLRHFYNRASLSEDATALPDAASADSQVECALFADTLRRAFEQLDEKQRLTLELYFFEGYTLREISERSGESLVNTRHHYYRGLEKLRKSTLVMSLRAG